MDTLVGGAVVAGSANLLNLLDLRPGRALKVDVALAAGGALARDACAARLPRRRGAARRAPPSGVLRPDLAGEAMLGDTGANAPAPCWAPRWCSAPVGGGRWAALAVLAALTLASEKVSFTKVIESTPVLRELDALGRPR